jgi:hypothetical protein
VARGGRRIFSKRDTHRSKIPLKSGYSARIPALLAGLFTAPTRMAISPRRTSSALSVEPELEPLPLLKAVTLGVVSALRVLNWAAEECRPRERMGRPGVVARRGGGWMRA